LEINMTQTKIEIAQERDAALAQVEGLRLQIAVLEGNVGMLQTRLDRANAWINAHRVESSDARPVQHEQRVVSAWTDRHGIAWQRVQVAPGRCAIRRAN
jgi:hypothetical protein